MTNGDTQLAHDVGEMLIGGFVGRAIDPEFEALVRAGTVGGAILFSRNLGNLEQTRALVCDLRRLETERPFMMAVDQEGGRVQRLRAPFPELPPMRTFGRARRKTLAFRAGEILAQGLQTIGFHQDYAPVLDVDSNPQNPVIGDRSFGSDASLVARLGAALIEGMQSAGVAACAKHFPGHGDTDTDSHLALPRLNHDLERLMSVELVPFVSAARADVAAIMTAHIVFAAFDADHPATLSEKVLEPLLRERVGYEGVIVSDDLEMKAIADHYGIEEAAVRAVQAGCDQLLICHQPALVAQAHRAIVQAVETGKISRARITRSVQRIAVLKRNFVVGVPLPDGPLEAALSSNAYDTLLAELEQTPADPAAGEYALQGDPTEIPEVADT